MSQSPAVVVVAGSAKHHGILDGLLSAVVKPPARLWVPHGVLEPLQVEEGAIEAAAAIQRSSRSRRGPAALGEPRDGYAVRQIQRRSGVIDAAVAVAAEVAAELGVPPFRWCAGA
jgi:hypothetical protein